MKCLWVTREFGSGEFGNVKELVDRDTITLWAYHGGKTLNCETLDLEIFHKFVAFQ